MTGHLLAAPPSGRDVRRLVSNESRYDPRHLLRLNVVMGKLSFKRLHHEQRTFRHAANRRASSLRSRGVSRPTRADISVDTHLQTKCDATSALSHQEQARETCASNVMMSACLYLATSASGLPLATMKMASTLSGLSPEAFASCTAPAGIKKESPAFSFCGGLPSVTRWSSPSMI